jgi:hypothetical protein
MINTRANAVIRSRISTTSLLLLFGSLVSSKVLEET